MGRQLLVFSAVLALSVTLSLISVTAQRKVASRSGSSQKVPSNASPANNPAAISREDYERDIRALSDQVRAMREQTSNLERTYTEQERSWYFGDRAPTWSNWILAVIAAVAGGVAYYAFTHQRDAVRLTQRADLLVQAIGIDPHPIPCFITAGTSIKVTFKNFGPTRAARVSIDVNLTIPDVKQKSADRPSLPSAVVGGNDDVTLTFPELGRLYEGETILQASKGHIPLSVGGRITYIDVFNREHSTTFDAKYYGWNRGGFVMERSDAD
jgi:hypothetical protein